jgi:hypothetical protein
MSGKMRGAGDAIMLVPDIIDNGALMALNLAGNNLGEMVLPEGWSYGYHGDYSGDMFYKHTDGRKQDLHPGKPEGIIALAAVIPGMGALTKLDISKNTIPSEQEGGIRRICTAGGIAMDI